MKKVTVPRRLDIGPLRICLLGRLLAESRYDLVVLWRGKIKVFRTIRSWREIWLDLKLSIKAKAAYLQIWPVYFETFSRDCDCAESTRAYRFPCYWLAIRNLSAKADDWSEGPFHYHQISRREYDAFEPSTRDRILEAFEDGRGSAVIL